MKMNELESLVFEMFPTAEIHQDGSGMIVIYTNMMMTDEGPENANPEIIPFEEN